MFDNCFKRIQNSTLFFMRIVPRRESNREKKHTEIEGLTRIDDVDLRHSSNT